VRQRTSPAATGDLALAALIAAVLVGLVGLAAVLILAAAITTVVFGDSWQVPDAGRWPAALWQLVRSPASPGVAFGPPWSRPLADHAGWYWAVVICTLAAGSTLLTALGLPAWQRFGPTPAGHADRAAVRRELTVAAARRTAEWTRPGLTRAERHRASLEEVGVPLHRSPYGRERLCTPLENPTGALAPTQSGKSRKDLVHKALGAPGALLCSTTKPDLLEFTAVARTRRPRAGPVLVYDATDSVRWPAKLRWSPVAGCTDPSVAFRRAHTMVEAASVGLRDVTGNDKVFRDRAKIVLQAYFLAAATHGRHVGDLVRWAMSKPPDQEPIRLLQGAGHADYARNLRAEIGMVAETSDAVWLSVRRVIEPFLDEHLRELCTPAPHDNFDVGSFIRANGSVYLVAGQRQAAQAAPLLTAFVEHWLATAQDIAMETPARRLDPPATAVLDELTTATPAPELPAVAADSAGRGVLVHWADQSIAALEEAYGPARTRRLLDNTTTLSVWGGLKDARTLDWVSTLTGHHERRRYQQQSDGFLGPGRTVVGTETVPTYRPGAVRTVSRGRVLVIHRQLDPILARPVDVKQRPDWKALRADVDSVRRGDVPVDVSGRAVALDSIGAEGGRP
jgi:type IV secretory pathway TraG/TraD family ATPase VirD4